MPMYEYVCMKCEEHFEELVRGGQEVSCPQCGATHVARQLSTFAMIGTAGQTGAFSGGGGGCCGGSCGCGH
jgi:putative FmdB family regulatory protein